MSSRIWIIILVMIYVAFFGALVFAAGSYIQDHEKMALCKVDCDPYQSKMIDGECYCKIKINVWEKPL